MTAKRSRKVYLGDSVYVEVVDGMLRLTTENGLSAPNNVIFLADEVWLALVEYVSELTNREQT